MVPQKIGRYKIEQELGRGGTATVYRAYDPSFAREVAIKVLPRDIVHSDKLVASLVRFRRELKTIASLEHPSIVPVYDVGEEGGQPFFVMRYMAGGSLVDWIKRGPIALEDTAIIIEKLAAGLNYAHQKGIIHRDIKPDNVLFDKDNHPYLTDFGVAKLTEASTSITSDEPVGTLDYVSPEQLEEKDVDGRSDIYSMGVMIYEMLTAQKPHGNTTRVSAAYSRMTQPVPNILAIKPDLPPEVAEVLKKAMAKEKKDRYATAIDLALAFSQAVFGEDHTLSKFAAVTIPPKPSGSGRAGWIFAGLLVIAGVAGWLGYTGQLPFLAAVPTASVTVEPTIVVPSSTPEPSFTATTGPTSTLENLTPTPIPIPGGADAFAFLSGNQIYVMNIGDLAPVPVLTDNSGKANLQWMPDGKSLIYTSGLCVYQLDIETNETSKIVCFNLRGTQDIFEGFRISPDGKLAAITISRALYIVPFDTQVLKDTVTKQDLTGTGNFCKYSFYAIKDIRWSTDVERIAALVADTQVSGTDQVYLLDVDIPRCKTVAAAAIDRFPYERFSFSGSQIPSYDWNGAKLFLVNDTERNDGFGNLYLYDTETHTGRKINPIGGTCCYRDARFSPDGSYILFAFQRFDGTRIQLYYIPIADIGKALEWTPLPGLDIVFSTAREKPQPALRSVQSSSQ